MPLYEYECEQCGHRFEKIVKFSDPPEETCPKCGGHVRKLIASPAIQFKGSGWYVTDYAKKDTVSSKPSKDSKDAKESTPADSGSEKKTDSGSTGGAAPAKTEKSESKS